MHFLIFNDIFSSVNTFDKKLFLLQNLERKHKKKVAEVNVR